MCCDPEVNSSSERALLPGNQTAAGEMTRLPATPVSRPSGVSLAVSAALTD
jgi:hypothetical protein